MEVVISKDSDCDSVLERDVASRVRATVIVADSDRSELDDEDFDEDSVRSEEVDRELDMFSKAVTVVVLETSWVLDALNVADVVRVVDFKKDNDAVESIDVVNDGLMLLVWD